MTDHAVSGGSPPTKYPQKGCYTAEMRREHPEHTWEGKSGVIYSCAGIRPASQYPYKDCELSQKFEEHSPHAWEKKPGWFYNCEGILPFDEQPPCQAYVSPEQPECGEPAPTKIRVKTKLIDARIDVCRRHKHQYDNRAATRRSENRPPLDVFRQAS